MSYTRRNSTYPQIYALLLNTKQDACQLSMWKYIYIM